MLKPVLVVRLQGRVGLAAVFDFFQCRGLRMQGASQRTVYDPNPFLFSLCPKPVTSLSYLTLGAVFLCKGPSFSRKHTLRNQYKI